jgi:hypothetical protein
MGHVIIGMDPHRRSATIEVINEPEKVLDQGRFGTDRAGYQTMFKLGRQYPDRIWVVAVLRLGLRVERGCHRAGAFLSGYSAVVIGSGRSSSA